MPETKLDVMKRWYDEVWTQHKTETIFELFAAEGVAYGTSDTDGDIHGPEEFVAFYERIIGSFSGMRFVIEDAIESGDKVAVRWCATMIHTGDKLGIRASGKEIRVNGITIARFESGKVIEAWDSWDKLGMMKQIGALQLAMSGGA